MQLSGVIIVLNFVEHKQTNKLTFGTTGALFCQFEHRATADLFLFAFSR